MGRATTSSHKETARTPRQLKGPAKSRAGEMTSPQRAAATVRPNRPNRRVAAFNLSRPNNTAKSNPNPTKGQAGHGGRPPNTTPHSAPRAETRIAPAGSGAKTPVRPAFSPTPTALSPRVAAQSPARDQPRASSEREKKWAGF